MQGLLMAARSCTDTDEWRYWHVGDLLWAFLALTSHFDPHEHICLWHNEHGTLAGFALVGEDPAFECQVLPEDAWAGIEEEALTWAVTRRTELAARNAQRWGGAFVWGAQQDDALRIAFLEQHGFQRGDHVEPTLLRSLGETLPQVTLPDGYHIR